ncbi:TonB-dependent receptor domain-containing protein [Catenovulum maritimum]|uniref:TonB-dependent receptor n=1 Tax=Catenovulum maritimum TaxID=1513271 RepID=A0A0J8GRX3_9ALTE|nr:TonB-dependent receptor [Catenovulum maritimum]KMT65477.1 hypothetical protein XM47_08995 [Catenovulum maritimum]
MYKRKSLSEQIRYHLLASAAVLSPLGMSTAIAAEENQGEETEVIEVTGVRNSLKEAAFIKKNANQIVDAISAEDIGQLPDNNIAEALQRVTGVQINRDGTGQGSGFQVRGLSQNRVEINGQGMGSGGDDRSNSFNAVDSALFSKIEVIKSPTADMVEGASGATVRLHTFKPLDFKKTTFNVSYQATKDDIATDWGGKGTLMGTTKFDLEQFGEIGLLFNSAFERSNRESHKFDTNWAPAIVNQTEQSSQLVGLDVFRPDNISINQTPYEDTRISLDAAVQWTLNENVQFSVSATRMELDRLYTKQGIQYKTNNDRNYFIDRDQDGTLIDESIFVIGPWYRTPNKDELYIANPTDVKKGLAPVYAAYEQPLTRYIAQSATVTPKGDLYNPPVQVQYGSNDENLLQETFQFGSKIFLTDDLEMNFIYATASSEKKVEAFTLNMGAGQIQSRASIEAEADLDKSEAEAVINLSSANVYYDFTSSGDVPNVGIIVGNGDFASMKDALLNPEIYTVSGFWGNESIHLNKKDSLSLDFDYTVDGDFFTKWEFGARVANNNINRQQNKLIHAGAADKSITSDNWRAYDQDLTTETMLGGNIGWSNPTVGWMDQVFEEHYGTKNYMSRYLIQLDDTFPGSNGDNVPGWLGLDMEHADIKQLVADMFPGRTGGNCTLYDKDEQKICRDRMEYPAGDETPENWREYDYTMDIPAAQFILDQRFPYLIEEQTRAIYLKANFENEIFDMPLIGNFGVRYVETDVESLGMELSRIIDEDTYRPIKDYDKINGEHYTWVRETNKYSNVLPSLNANLLITDKMFLRFAFSKTMTRPNPSDMSPSFSIPTFGYSGSRGNPRLKPEKSTNYDLSWEWYPDDVNQFSTAIYYKQLDDFLTNTYQNYFSPEDRDKNGEWDDPVAIKQPSNGDQGSITGIELAATHTFEYLPSWLSGFGAQANYTITKSDQGSGFNELDGSKLPIKDLSEKSTNFILFYDKYGFNFRAAFNFRDESYSEGATGGPDQIIVESYVNSDGEIGYRNRAISLPVWNDSFQTLDLSMSYKHKGISFYFQVNNVLDEPKRRYVGDLNETKHLLREYNETGPYYTMGVRARFN